MPAPQEALTVNGCKVLLMGTIPGFVPDGDRVTAALKDHQPQMIGLGIPPEDVENLAALAADPSLADGLEPDELDEHFLATLEHWGATQAIPSPDLQAANASELPLLGLDLDDTAHTDRFTELVKVRHLVQRSSARRKLRKSTADDAPDAYALAEKWDSTLREVAPLNQLENEREEAMAANLVEACQGRDRVLAIVHVARFAGVARLLRNEGQALS